MYKKPNVINRKNAFAVTAVALLFAMTFASLLAAFPVANAHTPSWNIPTFAYIQVAPNPVGVNQQVFATFWLDKVLPSALATNDIRFHNYKLTITKPDGTTEVQTFPTVDDTTSSQFTLYTPTQIGTYKFKFEFPGQTYTWTTPSVDMFGNLVPNAFTNDTYLHSSAETTLTVQQAQVTAVEAYPLPTTYWSRPIEGQNTEWATIASNWLSAPQIVNNVQPDGIAPNSPHIMWTIPLQNGGIVGGESTSIPGVSYYTGMSYEGKFANPIIMQGRLYYPIPSSNNIVGGMGGSSLSGGYACVDLQTGQRVWWKNYAVNPTFGQIYDYESRNQHGALGFLWAVSGSTWIAYEPETGDWLFNLTNVPSGVSLPGLRGPGNTVYTSKGEIVSYILDTRNNRLALWNNTAAPGETGDPTGMSANAEMWRPVGKVIDASTAYSWNVTVPATSMVASIFGIIPDDTLLVQANFLSSTGASGNAGGTPSNAQIWAISLKPASRGQLLWTKIYVPPANNVTRMLIGVDPESRMFFAYDKETLGYLGFSIDDGRQVWGPVAVNEAFGYYNYVSITIAVAYGNMYVSGYNGVTYCFDGATGNVEWTYGNGGEGNSTHCGLDAPYGNYPTFVGAIADNKVYLFSSEHSPNAPLWKGEKIRCIDATTGKEFWAISGWGTSGMFYMANGAIADGYYAYLNGYDLQIYCIGKGPSKTTVSAPQTAVPKGTPAIITGSVTDQTPSSEAKDTPAISDASMGAWMEYLYMQKPMPTDATGVQVKLTAIDPNGNWQDIGTATTDTNGNYGIMWTPPVEGIYKIIATFAGTGSYYGSDATAYMGVEVAPAASPTVAPTTQPTEAPTTAPTATPTVSPSVVPEPEATPSADLYIIAAAAAVIIVVVAAAAVFLKKRQ